MSARTVLFVSWDGSAQNYLVDLFLPILSRLRQADVRVEILQFSTATAAQQRTTRAAAEAAGVPYRHCAVWKGPRALMTAGMIGYGASLIRRLIRRDGVQVVMPRSAIPAAMCLMGIPDRSVRMVFDADGLMPDERVEFEGWSPYSASYRLLREVEIMAVRKAAAVLTRSARATQIALDRCGPGVDPSKVLVVLNGRDPAVYHPGTPESREATRARLGLSAETPFVLYLGSLGAKYGLERMSAFLRAVHRRRPDTRFQILTGHQQVASAHFKHAGLPTGSIDVRRVRGDEVPAYIAAADLGLALISPGFSVQAATPIKIGEYLLCGTPVLASPWCGDTAQHLRPPGLGRVTASLSESALEDAADWFVHQVLSMRDAYRDRCRHRGVELFSVASAVSQYRRAIEAATRGGNWQ